MPRNTYISHGSRSEKDLFSDLMVEAIKIYGHDVLYIPRKIVKMDNLLNEDAFSEFKKAYMIEMYIESVDGFEGDGKLLSKFGLEIRDQAVFVVARRQWKKLVERFNPDTDDAKPREGDLIYLPMSKSLFEIKYSDDKKPFFQLNSLPVFRLTCELFEYGHQSISTGHKGVDGVQKDHSMTHRPRVIFLTPQAHIPGEMLDIELPSGITGTAKLLKYKVNDYPEDVVLSLGNLSFADDQFHQIVTGTVFTGRESATISEATDMIGLTDGDEELFEDDAFAQNSTFELASQDIISWDESNPFGSPNL